VRWPWGRRPAPEVTNTAVVRSDEAAFAAILSPGGWRNIRSVVTDEQQTMGLSAVFRAVSLIAGQLASLNLRTYTGTGPERRVVGSIFDDPDPTGQTPFEWKETAFVHLLLHGRAGAVKQRTAAGGLTGLPWAHPDTWKVRRPLPSDPGPAPVGGLWFDVTFDDGKVRSLDVEDFWYVPAISTDGRVGMGLIEYASMTLSTAAAGDAASGNMFVNGAMISGLATPDTDDYDITDDVPEIRRQINSAVTGVDKAGTVAVIARRLKFTPWTMSNADAQFLQSRQFSIEEISRFTGVPPHLLMQTEKQTSWGTGVDEQNRALGRTVLGTYARRFEERASRLLPKPRAVEFDFTTLERPSPDREIELDLSQVAAGVMTKDEYRLKRGWGPLPDEPAADPAPDPAADPEEGSDDDPPTE
jgi:HK97 family phage portal protein